MKLDKSFFNKNIDEFFEPLPKKIITLTTDNLEDVFSCDLAKNNKNIVYIWQCEKEIPRLNGSSNVVYIGQTKRSLYKRHFPTIDKKIETEANSLKYAHILETYGPITISVCNLSKFANSNGEELTLLELEGQLLWWYFLNHYEYPPVNYTKTTVRTPELYIGN